MKTYSLLQTLTYYVYVNTKGIAELSIQPPSVMGQNSIGTFRSFISANNFVNKYNNKMAVYRKAGMTIHDPEGIKQGYYRCIAEKGQICWEVTGDTIPVEEDYVHVMFANNTTVVYRIKKDLLPIYKRT